MKIINKYFQVDVFQKIFRIPRVIKVIFIVFADFFTVILSVWLAFGIRLDQWNTLNINVFLSFFIAIGIYFFFFFLYKINRVIFRYSSESFIKDMSTPLFLYTFFYFFIFSYVGVHEIPRSIGVLQPVFFILGLAANRFLIQRIYKFVHSKSVLECKNFIVYGAGSSGRQLVKNLYNSPRFFICGFIDDDKKLHGHTIDGFKIYSLDDLPKLAIKYDSLEILISISSLSIEKKNIIFKRAYDANVKVSQTPTLLDVITGKFKKNELVSIDVGYLLGRSSVDPNHSLLLKSIQNKVIVVTGAGGSIGSELCRQITNLKPSKLILIENNEYSLYSIYEELKENIQIINIELFPVLCSVLDRRGIEDILRLFRPDTIFHAAAFKHVPLIEFNQSSGFFNNVIGTLTCAQAAIKFNVGNFILVSTDKAVRPTNMLGASKRTAEMILQALHIKSNKTKFAIVRFGNVLGSSGSVVPLFQKQIDSGGPITVTHPDVTRYFMTIPEASQLIIQAAAISTGGEVFVLDMGKPIKISDLAKKMIELNGIDFNQVQIKFVGLRPGEKLFEELIIDGVANATIHPKIFNIEESSISWCELEPIIKVIQEKLIENNIEEATNILKKIVKGYEPYPISDFRKF
jgi:FlaA1/EpsC-like NDP-sugar epimerase